MIKIQITEEMKRRARERCLRDKAIYGFHNSRAFVSDKRRYLGLLGEEMISSYLNTPLDNHADYDIVLNGYRVEIKSQGINVHWVDSDDSDFKLNTYKLCEDCDKYIFVIVHNSFDYGWFIGHIPKEDFNAKCERKLYMGDLKYDLSITEIVEVF